MQGRIVFFSADTRSGTILADEGSEFRFHLQAWRGNGFPPQGQLVSFRVANAEAVDVQPATTARGQPAQGGVWFSGGSQPASGFGFSLGQGMPDASYHTVSNRPSFWTFYFSWNGRVSLGQYWLNYLLPCSALAMFGIGLIIYMIAYSLHHQVASPVFITVIALVILKMTVLAWVSFVMHCKRFHDLNMSWGSGYVIESFMPFGRDWMLFRLMCERGTPGPNDFGPDPRESQ
jgi:uncharacterized membrane protein YhaH (DUF805 family)